MKKEILHIDSYIPKEQTWLFQDGCLSLVEQVRIVTVPHEEWGYNCHVEYVYLNGSGDRGVWIGGDCTPFDAIGSWMFKGNHISLPIFKDMYMKQNHVSPCTHIDFYDEILYECLTYWNNQLIIEPEVAAYCQSHE